MRLTIHGRNIDITSALREYAEEKIGKILKHNDQIMDIVVSLGVIKNPSVQDNHYAEVTCLLNGAKIHVKETAESMYASIDLVANILDRQIKKHKEKLKSGKVGANSIRNNNAEDAQEIDDESEELDDDVVKISLEPEEV
jgi:putative sigma-54 modulation protein